MLPATRYVRWRSSTCLPASPDRARLPRGWRRGISGGHIAVPRRDCPERRVELRHESRPLVPRRHTHLACRRFLVEFVHGVHADECLQASRLLKLFSAHHAFVPKRLRARPHKRRLHAVGLEVRSRLSSQVSPHEQRRLRTPRREIGGRGRGHIGGDASIESALFELQGDRDLVQRKCAFCGYNTRLIATWRTWKEPCVKGRLQEKADAVRQSTCEPHP